MSKLLKKALKYYQIAMTGTKRNIITEIKEELTIRRYVFRLNRKIDLEYVLCIDEEDNTLVRLEFYFVNRKNGSIEGTQDAFINSMEALIEELEYALAVVTAKEIP